MKKLLDLVSMGGFAIALTVAMAAQAPRPSSATKTATAAPSASRDGIKVHGHWTIVVRNPDGSVAARREFENSLQLDGANLIPMVLGGFAAPGAWAIELGDNGATSGPCGIAPLGDVVAANGAVTNLLGSCFIITPGENYTGPNSQGSCSPFGSQPCSQNLAVTLVGTGSVSLSGGVAPLTGPLQTVALQLSGEALIQNSSTINYVATLVEACTAVNTGTGLTQQFTSGYPPTSLAARGVGSPAGCASLSPASANSFVTGSASLGGTTTGGQLGSFYSPMWGFTASAVPQTPTPFTVSPLQSVQVTVVITFS